jgi:hypothetical protein
MAKAKSPSGKRKDETPVNNTVVNTAAVAPPPAAARAETVAAPAPAPVMKANGSREPAKLSVVKTDPRATVMPINLEEEIRRRAYELSEHRGFTSGHEADDWLVAENEVLQRYRQHSA